VSSPALPTVLTVEDHPIVRADLRMLLEEAGFAVCAEARDGVEAVALASSYEPDVILLDLALPLLDGIEATRRILEHRDVPIVALTGYRTEGLVERAVAAGASSYVLKPYGQGELVAAVRDAIDRHVEQRALRTAREASRKTLADMLTLLGYPEHWADTLEADSYRRGKLWRNA
jgi:DNA-binding NarL/FixJ family response regulator